MKKVIEHIRIDDELIDQGKYWLILDPVISAWSHSEGAPEHDKGVAQFSKEQRMLAAILVYEAEVVNGGHTQFYGNYSGALWKDALDGLRELKQDGMAQVLRESAERLGSNPSMDWRRRQGQLDNYEGDFEDLDRRFSELDSKSDMFKMMSDYIRDHRSKFYFEGDVVKVKRNQS